MSFRLYCFSYGVTSGENDIHGIIDCGDIYDIEVCKDAIDVDTEFYEEALVVVVVPVVLVMVGCVFVFVFVPVFVF